MAASRRLDPAPFREWCNEQIVTEGTDELGGYARVFTAGDLALKLGTSQRSLYRWLHESTWLDRPEIEAALDHAGIHLWELYPDLPEPEPLVGPQGPQPGAGSKLSDEQVRVLHRLHVERELSIRELGRRIYAQVGYFSEDAAVFGIRSGFRRLGLEAKWRHPTTLATVADRYCKEDKADGERCGAFAMRGEEYCWPHHPDNRDAAAASIARANAARSAVAA
ncbi:MAG TPA: hypothetical protein VFX35_01365 [Solirubrobacterales bacterium]|nr:hypothetical protein [Solirubrobacterales bacterium]